VEKGYGESVVIWGFLDEKAVNTVLSEISDTDKDFRVVTYEQFYPLSFYNELLNAIAEGRSPDIIILPSDSIVLHRAKLQPISYDTITKRDYMDAYIDGAEIFLLSNGVYGFPFAVDPMVMYWNKDLYSTNGLAKPPSTWEQVVYQSTPALTRTNSSYDITQSALAFGEYGNIAHAKEIVAMLFLQAGTTIVDEVQNGYEVSFVSNTERNTLRPADAALSFYTQFALPSGANYSWNRSLPSDRLQFLGGTLATYFGFGSEYKDIQDANPNLNFDMAQVPQGGSATIHHGFGAFYALSIPQAASNKQGAYKAIRALTGAAPSAHLAELLNMAPVSRIEIARGTNDPYRKVLYEAALIARAWLDPNPEASENVFRQLIEDVTSGRARVTQSVADAAGRLKLLFR
jgi:ABC-type glycerol-3-phosphate transport system substrate-binding protein